MTSIVLLPYFRVPYLVGVKYMKNEIHQYKTSNPKSLTLLFCKIILRCPKEKRIPSLLISSPFTSSEDLRLFNKVVTSPTTQLNESSGLIETSIELWWNKVQDVCDRKLTRLLLESTGKCDRSKKSEAPRESRNYKQRMDTIMRPFFPLSSSELPNVRKNFFKVL